MGTISNLFKREDYRSHFERERERRRRMEIAAEYASAREEALIHVVEAAGLHEEAGRAMIESAVKAREVVDAEIRPRHARERQ